MPRDYVDDEVGSSSSSMSWLCFDSMCLYSAYKKKMYIGPSYSIFVTIQGDFDKTFSKSWFSFIRGEKSINKASLDRLNATLYNDTASLYSITLSAELLKLSSFLTQNATFWITYVV